MYPLWIRIRTGSGPDPIIHKQVMGTYLPGTEILDPKCLLVDAVSGSGPDPV